MPSPSPSQPPPPPPPRHPPHSVQQPRRDAPGKRVFWMRKAELDQVFEAWQGRIEEALKGDGATWALVGIKRRGAVLARRLWKHLSTKERPLLYGEIDISLYRDDYHLQTEKPMVLGTEISFRVDGVKILLVDDVLYTGRTVRAAMDLILDFGRPRVILLAVFVDRGHRELPIAANFVGKEIPTERQDQVLVTLAELGEEDGVDLIQKSVARGKKA